jgi:hypothetical protein
MHHNRVRRVDARTHIITTVAGNGSFGAAGDDGPATAASLAGPAGVAIVEDTLGRLTLFIADSYNGTIRSVTPDGTIHNVGIEGRVKFGTPSRVAFATGTQWLYVADSMNDKIVALNIPPGSQTARARTIPASSRGAGRKVG